MIWLLFSLILLSFFASYYQTKLVFYGLLVILLELAFFQFSIISRLNFTIIVVPSLIVFMVLNIKKLRVSLITQGLFNQLKKTNNEWSTFKRIDTGWFASDFEKSIFQGRPDFKEFSFKNNNNHDIKIETEISEIIAANENNSTIVNKLANIGASSLIINATYGGQNLSVRDTSQVIKNISKTNPILASIIGIMNLDSLTSIINHFASYSQKKKFLPLIAQAKLVPFLKPTSLFETLDSQKSSIEGRVDSEFIKGKEIKGIRVSFQDLILLGTTKSNCFYINVNIKDFNNIHIDKTNLGTALCILTNEIKGLKYQKGLKAYNDHLYYYACTGENVFIPFSYIVNESNGIGKGLEYLYKNQCYASNIWPLALSIPTNNTATLTAWYFAHLQKQNGRQLLSYKLVIAKLNEQFSQCLKFQLMDNVSLHKNLQLPLLKYTAILNKESHISHTMQQLGLLRGILGSNAHNIKTESKIRSFYKVAHLATELDGMSYEINQLPLIKKAALACHPFYHKEIELMTSNNKNDVNKFDKIVFQHVGYILHNLTKVWAYTFQNSLIGRLFFQKNKYKIMIKRMSSSFAFMSDISLITWTFKRSINTSFASHLGLCIQHITSSVILYDYYQSTKMNSNRKLLVKNTLKNTLFDSQNALKNAANLAFRKLQALIMKVLVFPLGKPFHQIKLFELLGENIEEICEEHQNTDKTNQYSPFLAKIRLAQLKLKAAESAETAVTNATGTPLNTDNYEVLINRCLAAGIVSVEQSEQLRDAYMRILEIKLTNHFGNHYEK